MDSPHIQANQSSSGGPQLRFIEATLVTHKNQAGKKFWVQIAPRQSIQPECPVCMKDKVVANTMCRTIKHVVCTECEQGLRASGQDHCPSCRTPCAESGSTIADNNRNLSIELNNAPIECITCGYTGEFSSIESHRQCASRRPQAAAVTPAIGQQRPAAGPFVYALRQVCGNRLYQIDVERIRADIVSLKRERWICDRDPEFNELLMDAMGSYRDPPGWRKRILAKACAHEDLAKLVISAVWKNAKTHKLLAGASEWEEIAKYGIHPDQLFHSDPVPPCNYPAYQEPHRMQGHHPMAAGYPQRSYPVAQGVTAYVPRPSASSRRGQATAGLSAAGRRPAAEYSADYRSGAAPVQRPVQLSSARPLGRPKFPTDWLNFNHPTLVNSLGFLTQPQMDALVGVLIQRQLIIHDERESLMCRKKSSKERAREIIMNLPAKGDRMPKLFLAALCDFIVMERTSPDSLKQIQTLIRILYNYHGAFQIFSADAELTATVAEATRGLPDINRR